MDSGVYSGPAAEAASNCDGATVTSLLLATQAGDRQAFAALYRATSPRLMAIALRILRQRELAEEALQETYLTIWRKAGSFEPTRGQALAWMATVARNQAIDRLRRARSGPQATVEWDENNEPAAALLRGEPPLHITQTVRQGLLKLQENHRKALLLAYYYGLTHEELAARLGAPLGTVKSWVRRGLAELKDCIES